MLKKKREGEVTKCDFSPTQQSGFPINDEDSPLLIFRLLVLLVANSAIGILFAVLS